MITKEDIFKAFKYYKGEKDNPFIDEGDSAMWWSGEKLMYEACEHQEFIDDWCEMYKEGLKNNDFSGPLLDKSISIPQKLIILYLDLWHGKWFPYEDLDIIKSYFG